MESLLAELPEAGRVALASARERRETWLVGLAFDARLERFVGASSEPMLTQMRLAWWRDRLREASPDRRKGDVLLDGLSDLFAGSESDLIALIDGWESMIALDPPTVPAVAPFLAGRSALCRALAAQVDRAADRAEVERCGRVWAMASAIQRADNDAARAALRDAAEEDWRRALSLPRTLGPLRVIGGLARRAIRQRRESLLGDRTSPLAALRLGLIGR